MIMITMEMGNDLLPPHYSDLLLQISLIFFAAFCELLTIEINQFPSRGVSPSASRFERATNKPSIFWHADIANLAAAQNCLISKSVGKERVNKVRTLNRTAAAIGGGDFLVWTLLVASEATMAFVMEELFRF